MSDAPQQPQLRLKPRVKSEAETAQAQPSPPPLASIAPPTIEPAKPSAPPAAPLNFKLRAPTLPPTADIPAAKPVDALTTPPPHTVPTPSSETITPAPTEAPETPTPEASSRLKLRGKDSSTAPSKAEPEASPESEPAAPDAAPKKTFKLSSKPPVTHTPHPTGVPPAFLVETQTAIEPPTPPEPPSQVIEPATPAPFPDASPASPPPAPSPAPKPPAFNKPPAGAPSVPPKSKIPHFKPSEKLNLPNGTLPVPGAKPNKGRKPKSLLMLLLVVAAFGTGGYYAYDHFFQVTPPPREIPAPAAHAAALTVPSSTPAASVTTPLPPSTSTTEASSVDLNSIAHAPAKLIAKAQESLAARRNIEQDRIDNPSEGNDIPAERGFPLTRPSAPIAQTNEVGADKSGAGPGNYSTIAPGIAATDSSIKTTGKPGMSFRRVVSELTIRGVFQGSPSRAHINGRIVSEGNPIDKELGIIFVGVNADDKMLVFRDATGATVMRRY